jgi:hypothetical protein
VSASSDGSRPTHGFEELPLILAGFFAWQLHFDIYGPPIADTVTENISLAVVADIHDVSVLGVKLTDRVISRNASVLTEGYDDFVL